MGGVTVDVPEIIRFFDEKSDYSLRQSTSVVAVVGEDLAAACFKRYLEAKERERGTTVCIRWDDGVPKSCKKKDRRRLDRWIVVDRPNCGRQVFQTEIKHWSCHSVKGECISLEADTEKLQQHKYDRWNIQWDPKKKSLRDRHHAKVLMPTKPPPGDLSEACKLPLIIYWAPMLPEGKPDEPLFSVCTNPKCSFKELWVFSVSSYLRSIVDKEPEICLKMPNAAKRLRILDDLFQFPS